MTRWQDSVGSVWGDFVDGAGDVADSLIYGLGFDDDDKQKVKYFVSGIPIIGEFIKNVDDYTYTRDYLKNRGMSWKDVKYPALRSGQSYGSQLNFVSSNISRLYDDH